ncbi:PLEKHD1 [Bugula neritina]|uniref:PLEKHD1 n=1 Tax=Bugula neritina TaxID=10212 RepID=A0A7J7JJF5_BUGNE|nr:PLEKHD1 [Bugula neritina]
MPTSDEDLAKVQLTGVLSKRPVNLASQSGGILASKWSKRFFVVKDGFLMYYDTSEKREFERRKCANYHPKGILPLGDCTITRLQEIDNPHIISVVNELSQERLLLQCESSWEQEKWLECLEKAARICFKNAQLGDTLIQQLQIQGARLAEEKQDAYTRLHDEARALSEEKSKTEDLERLMSELEEEKQRIETVSEELQKQFEQVRGELDATVAAMKEVEEEKAKLAQQQSHLSTELELLEKQKLDTESQLSQTKQKTVQLEDMNFQLSNQSEQAKSELAEQIKAEQSLKLRLQKDLEGIESEMKKVTEEKNSAEMKAKEQLELSKLLEDEKLLFYQEARELKKNLSDVKHQKEMTEAELKEEIKARISAERRLKEAELALGNIENRLNEAQSVVYYFEHRAIEERIDADKPIIMKRAVYNKRRNLRAQSVHFLRQADQNLASAEGDAAGEPSAVKMRHSACNVLKDTQLRSLIAKSVHGQF